MAPQIPTNVIVHPLVLLSVVDHYNRVAKDTNKRVLGCLLGSVRKGEVDAFNSFAIPFEEDEKDPLVWYLDHNYMEMMFSMFRKVNSREKIIGWYSTGPKIRQSDLRINEVFRRYTTNPVYVIINVAPQNDFVIPTEAYCGIYQIKDDGTSSESVFSHVPSNVGAVEAEEIGVEHLLRGVKDTTISTLGQDITSKLNSLKGLHQRLLEIQTYLEHVYSGKMPINHEIIYQVQEIFNLLPSTHMTDMSQALALESNDMMLVIYLSSLVRSVVALHELISNKYENKLAEKKAASNEKEQKNNETEKKEEKKDDKKDDKKETNESSKKKEMSDK